MCDDRHEFPGKLEDLIHVDKQAPIKPNVNHQAPCLLCGHRTVHLEIYHNYDASVA